MKYVSMLLPLLLSACFVPTRVVSADAGALADRGMRIVVLDLFDGSRTQDASLLQMHLSGALRHLGYRNAETAAERSVREPWSPEAAAAAARKRNVQAALVVEIRPLPSSTPPAGDLGLYSTESDPSGVRRTYYLPELKDPSTDAPEFLAVARLVDAASGRLLYVAEVRAAADDVREAALAKALVAPLADY